MHNYDTNVQEWIQKFPLSQVEVEWHGIDGETKTISAPADLAGLEQIRAKVAQDTDLGRRVPVDLFLFSEGEPERRWATKIGGIPYRPRTIKGYFGQKKNAWPMSSSKEPKTFLAQFCFADSKDLVGELPGDVLLLFVESEDCDEDGFTFEWYSLGLTDLIPADEVPEQADAEYLIRRPCYGHIHRTFDYPDAADIFKRSGYEGGERLAVTPATKIGGVPLWIGNQPSLAGRHLCTLSSLQISAEVPYPWVNRSKPYTPDDLAGSYALDALMLGDMGSSYFYMDKKAKIRVYNQSA